jgi:chemotaxis protein MotB
VLASLKDRQFQVGGHTDNKSIHTKRFPSNWELSGARAIDVGQLLIEYGVPGNRISAAAYADTQPTDSNETKEGRAKNRRIEIALQPNLDELPDLSGFDDSDESDESDESAGE